jgi:hypothetical protein
MCEVRREFDGRIHYKSLPTYEASEPETRVREVPSTKNNNFLTKAGIPMLGMK